MSDAASEAKTSVRSAGSLLREARQAQGMHIAALAATIKVSQRKLESLEADRLDELPDATFTRALAQTVCRALKTDPAPVLALLPASAGHRLEHVSQGINQPFRERATLDDTGDRLSRVTPGMWAALGLVLLAAVVYMLPQSWLSGLVLMPGGARGTDASPSSVSIVTPQEVLEIASVASSAASQVAAPTSTVTGTVPAIAASEPTALPESAPTPATISMDATVASTRHLPASTPGVAQASAADEALWLRAAAPTWVEIRDARSRVVMSRLVREGEEVTLDAAAPLRVKIGNARATQLTFRGKPVDLPASTRDNVARLELK